jgi:hypothetical protein
MAAYLLWLISSLWSYPVCPVAEALLLMMGNLTLTLIIAIVTVSWADLLLRFKRLDTDKATNFIRLRLGLMIALAIYAPVMIVLTILWSFNIATRITMLIADISMLLFVFSVTLAAIIYLSILEKWLKKLTEKSKTMRRIARKNHILIAQMVLGIITIIFALLFAILPTLSNYFDPATTFLCARFRPPPLSSSSVMRFPPPSSILFRAFSGADRRDPGELLSSKLFDSNGLHEGIFSRNYVPSHQCRENNQVFATI